MSYPRPCKRCGKKFKPSGKFCKYCINCKKASGNNRIKYLNKDNEI
jgi:hypothetical protein